MSYETPQTYWGAQPKVGIPGALVSDDLLSFKGSRSVIRQIPASSGSNVGPSSSILFQIPQDQFGFIKPGSMYLQCKIVVTQTGGAGVSYAFAGQNGVSMANGINGVSVGCGGASSLLTRLTLTLPGGSSFSYSNQNHWRNAILPHALSDEFFQQDLRELEGCGAARINTGNTAPSKTSYCCIPLDLPCFNSSTAFPLLLCSGGLTLEIITATAIEAFFTAGAGGAITDYAISEMYLVYESLQVSPEYKQALLAASVERPFSLPVRDRVGLGAIGVTGSNRVNIGLGLSSLRAVVGTFAVTADWNASANPKVYKNNGMTQWNLYVNGLQVTPNTITNDAACYAELQRALSAFNDSNVTSSMIYAPSADASAVRNNYTSHQYAFGCSTDALGDSAFALCGVPADTISVETICGTITAEAWQNATGPAAGGANMYLWALYDSVLTFQPDGTCVIRK